MNRLGITLEEAVAIAPRRRMVIYRAFSHASPDCRQPDGQLALRGFGTASRRVPPLFGTQYDPLCM